MDWDKEGGRGGGGFVLMTQLAGIWILSRKYQMLLATPFNEIYKHLKVPAHPSCQYLQFQKLPAEVIRRQRGTQWGWRTRQTVMRKRSLQFSGVTSRKSFDSPTGGNQHEERLHLRLRGGTRY